MSEKKEPVINLADHFKTDQVCNTCHGPLEVNRNGMCKKCKLRTKVLLFLNIIEGTAADARMDLTKYTNKEDEYAVL